VPRYRELYGDRAYAPKEYQERIAGTVRRMARKHGVGDRTGAQARRIRTRPEPTPEPEQLPLL
jgi:hypothetical protein